MNEPQVIEGTREEIREQLQLFPKEQRFRLIVLSAPDENNGDDGPALAEHFKEQEEAERHRGLDELVMEAQKLEMY